MTLFRMIDAVAPVGVVEARSRRALAKGANRNIFVFFVFLIHAMAGPAFAEPKKNPASAADAGAQPPPAIPADPQATSATYGDWVHVCQRHAANGERLCEISQSIQVQGQPGPIAQLAVSAPKEASGVRLTAVLPANILLTEAPRVAVDEKDAEPVALAWQRCLPGGCFEDAALDAAVLAKWQALTERGRLEFKDGLGRTLVVPFSYRGFAQAFDALVKK